MQDHDGWYKLMFSHRELVEALVRGFVREGWVAELDLDTLEPVSSSYVSEQLDRRESDVVWRVDIGDGHLYIFLLVEFQSTVDRWMALRIWVYLGLLYQHLVRSDPEIESELPPVLPFVIYNGRAPWTAAREVANLITPGPDELAKHRPRLAYVLIDAWRLEGEPPAADNLAAALFRLEASQGTHEVREIVAQVAPAFARCGPGGLDKVVAEWVRLEILAKRDPDLKIPEVSGMEDLLKKLQQRPVQVEPWILEAREEGKREGKREGQRQGERQGEARLLERQLRHRFGPLPEDARKRLAQATSRQLLRWGERFVTADSLDAVFRD